MHRQRVTRRGCVEPEPIRIDWTEAEIAALLDLIRDERGEIDPDRRVGYGEGEALALSLGRSPPAIRSKLHKLRRGLRRR